MTIKYLCNYSFFPSLSSSIWPPVFNKHIIFFKGRPRPEVSWWLDDQLVDHTFVGTSENVVQNVLVIQRLERRHLHAELRCQASNHLVNPATMPSSSSNPGNGTAAVIHAQQQQQLHRHHVITSSVQLNLNCKSSSGLHHQHPRPPSVPSSILLLFFVIRLGWWWGISRSYIPVFRYTFYSSMCSSASDTIASWSSGALADCLCVILHAHRAWVFPRWEQR